MTSIYAAVISLFVGAMWGFNHWRQQRLDKDPGQQQLAALLIKASAGRFDATRKDVAELLSHISKGAADRRVRLNHAVMLVRSEAAPDLYQRVLALSRGL